MSAECAGCPAGLACVIGISREWFECTVCARRYMIVKEGAFYTEIPIEARHCRQGRLGGVQYAVGHCQECAT